MIAEDLKSKVDGLLQAQRHELSTNLTKLELGNYPDYWKAIRERIGESGSEQYVNAEVLKESYPRFRYSTCKSRSGQIEPFIPESGTPLAKNDSVFDVVDLSYLLLK